MIRMMKYLSCIMLFSAIFCVEATAQTTIRAASCSEKDVQSAIGKATTDGDVVSIPAGTCSWSSQMKINPSNSITIQGAGAEYATSDGASTAGTDQTIIKDDYPNNPLIVVGTTKGKSFRLTGIDFTWDSNNSGGTIYSGVVSIWGSTHSVQIDHCHFNDLNGAAILVGGSVTGVANHNLFNNVRGAFHTWNGNNWTGGSESAPGDQSWTDGSHFGSSRFMFYEDNLLEGGGADCEEGGRYVFRHNTLNSKADNVYEHGTGPDRRRGCRAAIVYDNVFKTPDGSTSSKVATVVANSGTLLYWGNTLTSFQNGVQLLDPRANNSVYTEATPPNGWGYCGTSFNGSSSPWDQNTDSSGYACLDEPGRGAGDLITGSFPNAVDSATGTATWPNQVLSPIYAWENKFTPVPNSRWNGIIGVVMGPMRDNRDYYMQFSPYGESGTFDGTKGVGQGSTVPTMACTKNVGYWDTENKTLYRCDTSGKWVAYYTPYTYPYPTDNSSASGPSAPSDLSAMAH